MSTRETLLAAVSASLVSANVAGGRVYRTRQEAIVTLPAVTVEPMNETADETVMGMLDRNLSIAVHVFASGDPADGAADATLAAIESALLADRTLGLGTEVHIRSAFDTSWSFDEQNMVRVTSVYQASYRTPL